MDASFGEQQQTLKDNARSFFEAICPMTLVRDMESKSPGYSVEMWQKMAGLGWLGMTYPQNLGGAGLGFLDLFVLYEEMGRVLAQTPHLSTVVLAGETILAAGSAAQKKRILPAIAKGDILIGAAIMEPNGVHGPEGVEASATSRLRSQRIKGTKILVPYADVADFILCPVRTETNANPAEGVTLLLVEPKTAGVSIEPLKSNWGLPLFTVTFDEAKVPEAAIVGKPSHGWEPLARTADRASILLCAEVLGASQRVLEMAASYSRQGAESGRPMGASQALLHRLCTDLSLQAASATLLARQAARRIDQGLSHGREVALARAAGSAMAHRLARQTQETLASVGMTKEQDIQGFTRRAAYWQVSLGDTVYQREAVAHMFGM